MIFVDANVFFDVVGKGKTWQDSYVILENAKLPNTDYYVSALSIIFLHMHFFKYHNEAARDEIRNLTKGFTIVPVTLDCFNQALDNMSIEDFEDSIQFYSAKSLGCQTIITNNIKDFNSVTKEIEILKPKEFIDKMGLGF